MYLGVLSRLQLYQDVLANEGRSRSPVRRVETKAMPRLPPQLVPAPPKAELLPKAKVEGKAMPRPKAQLVPAPPKAELLPKAKVKAKAMPAHGSVLQELGSASSSSGPGSEVPSPEPWELDTHEWVQRGCWACKDCGSMTLLFTLLCTCGKRRQLLQEQHEGDWFCYACGNLNFRSRKWCIWSECPIGDWECPKCGNRNVARRRVCNRNACQHPREW